MPVFAISLSDLPSEVKEKLAVYLASAVPNPSAGNRSSNALYFKLTENVSPTSRFETCISDALVDQQISMDRRLRLEGAAQ